MPRGRYREYLRNEEVPIPNTTQRRRLLNMQRAAMEAGVEDDQVSDEERPPNENQPSPVQSETDDAESENDVNSNAASSNGEGGNVSDGSSSDAENEADGEEDYQSDDTDVTERDFINEDYQSDDTDVSERDLDGDDNNFVDNDNVPPHPERVPLYDGCHITLDESRLLILSFALRFSLSDKAIASLLKIIDCHLPYERLGSFHTFKKGMPAAPLVHMEYYCPQPRCERLLEFPNGAQNVDCECGHESNKKTLHKQGSFFLRLPLKDQLVSLFEDEKMRTALQWENEHVSDVVSGRFYKTCVRDGIVTRNQDLTVQFNLDGVQLFTTSSIQAWPIQVCVNELPFKIRRENMILCGLWYGDGKPNMNTFLEPFVRELNSLHENGFHFPSNPPKLVRVHAILSSVDSMARAPMQHLKTFRGVCGCSFCLHPGEEHAVGRGTTRLYRGDLRMLRSEGQHRRAVLELLAMPRIPRDFAIDGIKGPSVLLTMRVFNIVESFVPDYMHCVLLGVVKTMFEFWTAGQNSEKDFYIGNDRKINEIDEVLLSIKPTCEITKTPRSLHTAKLWRAHEWRSFLLYYSIPCLKAVNFPQRYLNHWFLLVFSMHCFLKDNITPEIFQKGKTALKRYVLTLEDVYGTAQLMKFNTHLLLHIPKAVKDFGGLFCWSTFAYEHYNGILAKMFRSSQAVPQQIGKNYVRLQTLRERTRNIVQDPRTPDFLKDILESVTCGKKTKHIVREGEYFSVLGAPTHGNLTPVQENAIENLLHERIINVNNSVRFYKRFVLNKVLYHIESYELLLKRLNCTAQADGLFVTLTHIVRVTSAVTNRLHFTLFADRLRPTGDVLCSNRELHISSASFATVVERTNECMAFLPDMFIRKCLVTFFPGSCRKLCCYPLVNLLERD